MSKLQKKPSALNRGHPTLQNMNFYKFFILLWVIFALLDPDPDPDSEHGSGSTGPIEYGSNPDPDPDPKPCLFFRAMTKLRRRTLTSRNLMEVPVNFVCGYKSYKSLLVWYWYLRSCFPNTGFQNPILFLFQQV
jgi:hypothetical protein